MNYFYILLGNCLNKNKYIKIFTNKKLLQSTNNQLLISNNKILFSNNEFDKKLIEDFHIYNNNNNNNNNTRCYQCNSLIENNTTIFCMYDKLFCTIRCRSNFYKIGKK